MNGTTSWALRAPLAALALALAAPAVAEGENTPPTIQTVDPNTVAAPGLDGVVYVDPEIAPPEPAVDELLEAPVSGSALDLLVPMHPLYTDLRRGLARYAERYGALPDVQVPEGPPLRRGQRGERVALLRQRLGLPAGDQYDNALVAAVRDWQRVHGQGADGVAGADTVASLNRGFAHYQRIILVNLERARRLPVNLERYILVDAAAAQLWLYEGGRPVDTMKVVVGTSATPTPMMAGLIRFAEVNPFWNVPEDFIRTRMAPRVLAEGMTYLSDRGYETLSSTRDDAQVVDPATIDWQAVAGGQVDPPIVRQRPGAANSMGEIKFMMPNSLGIYLHDTPDKSVFERADRWISNGCVRLEDAQRLARWLFGAEPPSGPRDTAQRADLPQAMPLFLNYFTVAAADDGGIVFRRDVYDRDPSMIARMFNRSEYSASSP